MSNEDNMPERDSLLFPPGYYATISGALVKIYRNGHSGDDEDEPQLLFSSDSIHERRPSAWYCGRMDDSERKVLAELLYEGWGYLLHL